MRTVVHLDALLPSNSRLTPLSVAERGKNTIWNCRCACGEITRAPAYTVMQGKILSCGCLAAEMIGDRSRKHGHCSTNGDGQHSKTYRAWNNMRLRCSNPKNRRYGSYGARGIKVCDRWQIFANFLADIGVAPQGLTLERRDNDGDYEPDNCCWAAPLDQARNRSTTKLNVVSAALIRYMHRRGETFESLGHAFGVTATTIGCVVKRKTWI